MFRVGERVRIIKDGGDVKYGNIALIEQNTTRQSVTALILYDREGDEEEVNINQVKPLLPFENVDFIDNRKVNSIKEDGNSLFAIKDFKAAAKQYTLAVNRLSSGPIRIGANCIVIPIIQTDLFRTGIVSDVIEGRNFEILFDETKLPQSDKDDILLLDSEESDVDIDRLIAIADDCNLQRMLYGNLAKCHAQLKNFGWAIRYIFIYI